MRAIRYVFMRPVCLYQVTAQEIAIADAPCRDLFHPGGAREESTRGWGGSASSPHDGKDDIGEQKNRGAIPRRNPVSEVVDGGAPRERPLRGCNQSGLRGTTAISSAAEVPLLG